MDNVYPSNTYPMHTKPLTMTSTRKRRGGRVDIEFYNPTQLTRTFRLRSAAPNDAILACLTVLWSDPQLHVVDIVMEQALLGEQYSRSRGRVPHPCYAKVDVSRIRDASRIASAVVALVRGRYATPMPPTRKGMETVEERWEVWATKLQAVLTTMRKRKWTWVGVGCV